MNHKPPLPPIIGRPPLRGTTANAVIHLRTTLRRKSAYVKAAKPRKLTDWVFEHLDRAANYKDEP